MVIDHPESAQAADFAAELSAQRVTWSRLEWWKAGSETILVAVTPGDQASDNLRQVGAIWSKQQ